MKFVRSFFPLFLVLAIVATATAAPMGVVKPASGRFSIGPELAFDRRDMVVSNQKNNFRQTETLYYLIRGNYGLTEKVEFTVRLGGANFDYNDLIDVNTSENTFDGGSALTWGLSVGAIVWEAPAWNLAGVANFLSHGEHSGAWPGTLGGNVEASYREWALGLQAQGKFRNYTPYLGVKYSDASLDYNTPTGTPDDEAEEHIGIYLGLGYVMTPEWSGYLEGRFIDEESFGAGLRYTF